MGLLCSDGSLYIVKIFYMNNGQSKESNYLTILLGGWHLHLLASISVAMEAGTLWEVFPAQSIINPNKWGFCTLSWEHDYNVMGKREREWDTGSSNTLWKLLKVFDRFLFAIKQESFDFSRARLLAALNATMQWIPNRNWGCINRDQTQRSLKNGLKRETPIQHEGYTEDMKTYCSC